MPTNQLRKKTVCTLYALIQYIKIYTPVCIYVYIYTQVYILNMCVSVGVCVLQLSNS